MAFPGRVVILSFEGPDRYASIGGLGTRVSQLARALGEGGSTVDLIFVGDPAMKPVEAFAPNVTLHRWSQWISAYHPRNCYDGEDLKVNDWLESLPPFVVETFLEPAALAGEQLLVIAEEWQTAAVAIAIDRLARARNLRPALTLLWNANNTYGWHRIDWAALQASAAITAVSKYMKFELSLWGVPALVIPNGLDDRLLVGADPPIVAAFRKAFGNRRTLVKVGRFDPDKNWLQAIDAVAELRNDGVDALLIVRGGREAYGDVVFNRAHERGLTIERLEYEGTDPARIADGIALATGAIVHLRAFLEEPTLFGLYAAADAVLANSGKEPFGLVGLEVMAAGGVAVCGATGEEYAEPFVNAIVCDTPDGRELATYLRAIFADPQLQASLRAAGKDTAARYTWASAIAALERKVGYVDAVQVS
jgi:glycosyltransferase involved in cell wall biosynthesis